MSSCILFIREVNAVHAEAMPYVEAISNEAASIGGPGPPISSIKSKESLMPLKNIMVAATPHSKLIASALSAPDLLLRLSTANAQEAHAPAPPLGTISYGSSITNSFTSTRQCSASSLKISIGLDEDDEEECQAPGTLNKESDLPLPRGSDDSDTGDDDDDEGENSFDGSDLAVSPSKAAASNSSPLGRRFHRGNTAAAPSNAQGKSERSSRSTHLAFSKVESLSNNDNDFDSTKDIGSSVKLNRGPGPDKSSKPTLTPSAASALLRTADNDKVPLSGVDLGHSGKEYDSSSREEDDEDDDDDDDFSEDNSMAASDDPIANVGKALDRRINTSVAAPQSLVRHRSEDAVDPSSTPDASISSPAPALALAKVGTHSLVHFDPLDPTGTGICSPRRSTLAPLSPLRSTLMPLSSSLVSPPVKAGLLSSYNASDTDKLRSDAMSLNHGSLSLLAAPLVSPRVSSLLPTSAVPAAGPSPLASPAIRPSPSVVSGSLLSTGRRAVDSTGTSANPPVTHIPPTVSAVAAMQPVASTYRSNSGPGPGNAIATHSQKPIDERDKEDENSNLDFDTSSWDEEDEAEDSS